MGIERSILYVPNIYYAMSYFWSYSSEI